MNSRSSSFDKIGLILLALVAGLVVWKLQRPSAGNDSPVKPGTPFPTLKVAGWLNLPDGQSFDPGGKIVVMDMWASYCGPCLSELPHLVTLAKRYGPLGVKFVGFTDETERELPEIKAVIERTPGFDWPVAYDARGVMSELNVRNIPTLIIFGPDGTVRRSWVGGGPHGVETTLDELLAVQRENEKSESTSPNTMRN